MWWCVWGVYESFEELLVAGGEYVLVGEVAADFVHVLECKLVLVLVEVGEVEQGEESDEFGAGLFEDEDVEQGVVAAGDFEAEGLFEQVEQQTQGQVFAENGGEGGEEGARRLEEGSQQAEAAEEVEDPLLSELAQPHHLQRQVLSLALQFEQCGQQLSIVYELL